MKCLCCGHYLKDHFMNTFGDLKGDICFFENPKTDKLDCVCERYIEHEEEKK